MSFLRKLLTIVVVIAMVSAGVLFALQNKAPVPLDLLIFRFEPRSLALWVLAAFALGGLVGMLVSSAITLRQQTSLRVTRRQLEKSRAELRALRPEDGAVDGASAPAQ